MVAQSALMLILFAGVCAAVLARLLIALALRRSILAHPNERSSHTVPTPTLGGVAIAIPVLGWCAYRIGQDPLCWAALIGGGLLVVLGLVDDLRDLPARVRFPFQCAAAGIALAMVPLAVPLALAPISIEPAWLVFAISFLFLLWMVNLYNFMDGIDGIAGTQGVVAGLGWVCVGLTIQDVRLATTGAVVGAANLGFLMFNWPPASIFMGDVGSSFLGFILAALVVLVAPRSPEIALAGLLFVWPFLFDTSLTFLRRTIRGEDLLSAHRSHLYQRLVLRGTSHRTVTLSYGALALVGVATGEAVVCGATTASLAGAIAICLLAAGLWLAADWYEPAAGVGDRR